LDLLTIYSPLATILEKCLGEIQMSRPDQWVLSIL